MKDASAPKLDPDHSVTPVSTFDESPILTALFGSKERFDAMSASETEALSSSSRIIDFLKDKSLELAEDAGGKALEWVSAQLLNAIGLGGGPSDIEQIKNTLNEILENQKLIISKLDQLLREVQFQHLITRGYDSVERITNIYERMQRLSTVTGQEEMEREAAVLKSGILDANLGTLLNLKTISDVMLGKDQLGQSDALISAFVERWFPVYAAKQLAPDVPLSTYADQLDAWLHGVLVIQFMGIAELANARIANKDFELLKQEIDQTVKQMEEQQKLLELGIPEWTRSLPASLFDGRWYVVHGLDLRSGNIDDTQVLYGSPGHTGYYLDWSVQFRDRHSNNADEEWRFEKTGQTDTFCMVERSRPCYISTYDGHALRMMSDTKLKMRLVMSRTNDPHLPPDAPRRDSYKPAIGFIDSGTYMTWTRGGTNVVFTGPPSAVVRIRIDWSGH